MSASDSAPALGPTLGAIELGVLLSSVFYGVTCVQAYVYAQKAAGDRPVIRLMVAATIVLETAHIVLTWIYFYDISVLSFNQPFQLTVPWSFDASLAVHALMVGLIQSFFAYRVYTVSGNLWLAVPGWFCAFGRTIVTWAIAALFHMEKLGPFKEAHGWIVFLTLALSVAGDMWITAALCFYLWSRHQTYTSTIGIVRGIIAWSMETGLALTLISIVIMIAWGGLPDTALWMSLLFIYTRLYSNSFLASLNARSSQRNSAVPRSTSDPSNRSTQYPGVSIMMTHSVNVDISDFEGSRTSGEFVPPKDQPFELAGLEGTRYNQELV